MKQSGFTLLEVLVAVLVLSIGLLGLAGLMATSIRNNQSAYQRTQATWLAYDIVDRMRANRDTALASGYNTNLGSPAACAAAPVLAGSMAAQDLTGWKTLLACSLPAGDGSVDVEADRTVTVTVQWNDSRGIGNETGNAGKSDQKFQVQTQL
ncbi:MAG: type IV pilus modification protein PilV [Thiobacillus sp.]